MSSGTPATTVRIPTRIKMQCDAYLEERLALACHPPWTLSEMIVVALCEKLDKIRRGRKARKRVLEQTELDDYLPMSLPCVVEDELVETEGGGTCPTNP